MFFFLNYYSFLAIKKNYFFFNCLLLNVEGLLKIDSIFGLKITPLGSYFIFFGIFVNSKCIQAETIEENTNYIYIKR